MPHLDSTQLLRLFFFFFHLKLSHSAQHKNLRLKLFIVRKYSGTERMHHGSWVVGFSSKLI